MGYGYRSDGVAKLAMIDRSPVQRRNNSFGAFEALVHSQ